MNKSPHEIDDDPTLDAALDETDGVLGESLAALLGGGRAQLPDPPADLEARTRDGVANSLMGRSLLGTGADLMTVGWQTVRFLLGAGEVPGRGDTDTGGMDTDGMNEEVRS